MAKRKDIRMEYLGQDLEGVRDSGTGAVEVLITIQEVNLTVPDRP